MFTGDVVLDPIQILNQHSFLLTSAGVLAVALAVARRLGGRAWALVPLTVVMLLGAYLAFRIGPSSVPSLEAAEERLASGRPALVEFYSDY